MAPFGYVFLLGLLETSMIQASENDQQTHGVETAGTGGHAAGQGEQFRLCNESTVSDAWSRNRPAFIRDTESSMFLEKYLRYGCFRQ